MASGSPAMRVSARRAAGASACARGGVRVADAAPSAPSPRPGHRPSAPRRAACSEPSRWGSRISRSASSGRSARARVISSKSSVAGISASSKSGPSREDVAARTGDERPAGKGLAALEADQLGQRDEDAVLLGDVLHHAAPSARGWPAGRRCRPSADHAAGRARARDDDELGAIQRREHRRERVPGVLADEDRGPAPAGVERLDAPAGLDEALLVEHAVGREGRPCGGRGGCRHRSHRAWRRARSCRAGCGGPRRSRWRRRAAGRLASWCWRVRSCEERSAETPDRGPRPRGSSR